MIFKAISHHAKYHLPVGHTARKGSTFTKYKKVVDMDKILYLLESKVEYLVIATDSISWRKA